MAWRISEPGASRIDSASARPGPNGGPNVHGLAEHRFMVGLSLLIWAIATTAYAAPKCYATASDTRFCPDFAPWTQLDYIDGVGTDMIVMSSGTVTLRIDTVAAHKGALPPTEDLLRHFTSRDAASVGADPATYRTGLYDEFMSTMVGLAGHEWYGQVNGQPVGMIANLVRNRDQAVWVVVTDLVPFSQAMSLRAQHAAIMNAITIPQARAQVATCDKFSTGLQLCAANTQWAGIEHIYSQAERTYIWSGPGLVLAVAEFPELAEFGLEATQADHDRWLRQLVKGLGHTDAQFWVPQGPDALAASGSFVSNEEATIVTLMSLGDKVLIISTVEKTDNVTDTHIASHLLALESLREDT